jgi:hypothetical protein
MLYIKRLFKYLNPQSLFLNDEDYKNGRNSKEIERVLIHDGENVLITTKWINKQNGGSHEEIILNANAKKKNIKDLNEKAFIIKTDYNYSDKSRLTYDLYIHIDLFNFEVQKIVKHDMLYITYLDREKDVKIENVIKVLRQESQNIQSKIHNSIKDLSGHNITKLEKDINNLKRNIKKYKALYENETKAIQELKNDLQ